MNSKHLDALEHRLSQDVAKFRRTLIEHNPELGKSELQRRIVDYTARRRVELEARAAVDA